MVVATPLCSVSDRILGKSDKGFQLPLGKGERRLITHEAETQAQRLEGKSRVFQKDHSQSMRVQFSSIKGTEMEIKLRRIERVESKGGGRDRGIHPAGGGGKGASHFKQLISSICNICWELSE